MTDVPLCSAVVLFLDNYCTIFLDKHKTFEKNTRQLWYKHSGIFTLGLFYDSLLGQARLAVGMLSSVIVSIFYGGIFVQKKEAGVFF